MMRVLRLRTPQHLTHWIVGIGMTVAIAGVSVAHAQEGDEREARPDQTRPDHLGRLVFQQQLQALHAQHMQLMQTLERRIARPSANSAWSRDQFEPLLTHRLDEVSLTCDLSDAQRKKLHLAGQGDVKRLIDGLESISRRSIAPTAEDVKDIVAEIDVLKRSIDGLFGDGSLFAKTLLTTLSREQIALLEKALRERNSAWYLSAVSDTVRKLARIADMSEVQSTQLMKLLLAETKPPRRIGRSDYAFVMYQASQIPEAKLMEIFQDAQWQALKDQLASWAGFRPVLEKEGFELDGSGKIAARHGQQMVPALRTGGPLP